MTFNSEPTTPGGARSWADISRCIARIASDYVQSIAASVEFSFENDSAMDTSGKERLAQVANLAQLLRELASLEGSSLAPDLEARELCARAEEDCAFAVEEDPAAHDPAEVAHCYPGTRALFIHRLAHVLWKAGSRRSARCLAAWAHERFGVDIHPAARIATPCFIDHGTGVVIGETAQVEARVVMYQGVTLGSSFPAKAASGRKRHPTILEGAKLFAHCSILGGDTVIGRNARVGLGALVVESLASRGADFNEGSRRKSS
jgi:serine O-acetyltransferase